MSLRPRTADALIGLLVITAIAIVIVALVVTRGWTEHRIVMYMLSPSVKDLKEDTPVFLQGLAIGEVKDISPRVGGGGVGPPQFLVALRLRERYANGVPIRLPLGTHAEIASTGLIGNASISLVAPPDDIASALQPGDTIPGQLTQGWTDVLKEVADTLRMQVSGILRDTRHALGTLDRTATAAHTELAATGPPIRATLVGIRATLDRLGPLLAQAETTLYTTDARMGSVQDSLYLLLTDTRRLINHADTLATTLSGLTSDLSPDVLKTLTTMRVVSAKLEHFIDQVSRRPHRLLTGVHQISRDSILRQDEP
jgi:ABC-type transporter Mla subunit MlaD